MEPIRVIPDPREPWRAYAGVALLLIVGSLASFAWVRQWSRVLPGEPATEPNSGRAAQSDSRMQAAAAFNPVMDVQIISDAESPESVAGMAVDLDPVDVRSVPDPGGFWVSQVRTPPIFIAFGPNARRVSVRSGDSVDLTGRVQRLPDRAAVQARWPALIGEDLDLLLRQGVYVEADTVSVDGQY